jgi:hypothetical protein
MLSGPQNRFWCSGEKNNLSPLAGIDPRFIVRKSVLKWLKKGTGWEGVNLMDVSV